MIRVLHAVPAALRPTVVGLVRFIDRLDHLPDGLHWLASRGAAASFEALVADLAACFQPGQFIARLKALISELPLPETLPPDQIGKARRIDRADGNLYARETIQELLGNSRETDRCWGMCDLLVGRASCAGPVPGDTSRPFGLGTQRGFGTQKRGT